MRNANIYHFLIVVAAVILAYLNVVHVGFLSLDDRYMVGLLQSSDYNIWKQFGGGGGDYFRPLVFLSYDLDLKLFGDNPQGFHLVNLAIHLANSILVYILADLLTRSKEPNRYCALVAAVFFALNPLNTEAVVWISGRFDLLCCFFFLLAMIVAIDKRVSVLKSAISLFIMLFCSLLSKEASAGFVLILSVYVLVDLSNKSKRTFILLMTAWVTTVVYLFFRTGFTTKVDSGITKVITAPATFSATVFDDFAVYGFYLKKLLFPFPLNFAINSIDKPLCLFIGIVVLLLFAFLFKRYDIYRLPILIVVFSLIPPVLAYQGGLPWTSFAERYLYLPMVGMALLIGLIVGRLPRTSFILSCLLIMLLAIPTMQRVNLWADSKAFWIDVIKKSPEFPRSYSGLAIEFLSEKRYDEAERLFKKTLSMGYEREFIWQDLASIYLARQEMPSYEYAMARAAFLAPAPRSTSIYNSLTQVLMYYGSDTVSTKSIYRKVVQYYLKAYEKDPTYSDGLYNAGKIAMLAGDNTDALRYLNRFLLNPGNSMFRPFAIKLISKINDK